MNEKLIEKADFNQLVGITRLMEIIFDEGSTPSSRFMLELKARGKIPYYKIGRRVFYKPFEVMDAISEMKMSPKTMVEQ